MRYRACNIYGKIYKFESERGTIIVKRNKKSQDRVLENGILAHALSKNLCMRTSLPNYLFAVKQSNVHVAHSTTPVMLGLVVLVV